MEGSVRLGLSAFAHMTDAAAISTVRVVRVSKRPLREFGDDAIEVSVISAIV
jgi:hypothetical protein